MNGAGVFRFDYEMKDSTWHVFIVAFNNDEALEVLTSRVGGPIRITNTTKVCRVDVLSDKVIEQILELNKPAKRGPGRPRKTDK